jgi:cation:H+ antiporter
VAQEVVAAWRLTPVNRACVVNLLFLVVVDALLRHQPMYRAASATHVLSAGLTSGLVFIGLVMRPQGRVLRVLGWISVALAGTSLVNALPVYLAGV